MIRVLSILMMGSVLLGPGDGKKKGRKGNAQYVQEQYSEAVASYQDGVRSVQENGAGAVHSGLLNNLGAALFRSGDAEQAGIAFSSAAAMAMSPEDLVRASYNAGNAAFSAQQLEASLENYRRALLNDPSNADAKFNYEFVKRQLDEQQEQEQDSDQNEEENDQEQDGEQDQENSDENQDGEDQQEQQDNPDDQTQQEQDQQQEQEQREREDPTKLSQEEAQRILQALENEEEQLLRQVQKMKTRPRRVEKDW